MTRLHTVVLAMAAVLGLLASPAKADEVFVGLYSHGVDTPLSIELPDQGGASVQLGYRFDPIDGALDIEPYLIASINTQGDTSFAGAGISRKFRLGPVYFRPGVGLVIQDQSGIRFDPVFGRSDLGSQVLFEPEIAIGTQLSDRVSVEASWTHISHAGLFDSWQNPGLDLIGARLNLKL